MKRAEIRKCFTDYAKKENLQDGKYVIIIKKYLMFLI